jgi:DNA-binding response OmpR family regulator
MNEAHESAPLIQALLVEDDARLAALTSRYLHEHGVVLTHFADAPDALSEAARHDYDVLLLDLMLPGGDGLAVCEAVRARRDTPIIILSARSDENDRVRGLEHGADDYLVKPFSSRELLARIRAQVRRARGKAGPPAPLIRVGGLLLDAGKIDATLDGRSLDLTAYEFALLRALAERAGQVLSRERLLDLVKGSAEDTFDRSIDVHIFRLRQKVEPDPKRPRYLKTVRGAGYVLARGDDS